MKRYLILLILIGLFVGFCGLAWAELPFFFSPLNPFFAPMPYGRPFSPSFGLLPPLSFVGPFLSPMLAPRPSLPLLSPMLMPRPLTRQGAATITIFFNPTLSVIQVTVLPIAPVTPPVTAVAPTVVAPPVLAPSPLLLLPLLTGLTGPTQTKTLTRLSTTTPIVPALTGIASLLPLI